MKPEEQIEALAWLDGWYSQGEGMWKRPDGQSVKHHSNYLESYDAIIPLIQKQTSIFKAEIATHIYHSMVTVDEQHKDHFIDWYIAGKIMTSTPAQLCESLLRATNLWKDSDIK